MAPIKEFSSADLNTISRLSGVSNVLVKVNGATVAASSFSGLLDTYTGAAAAYSVRKLDKDYTGSCMRIVVDSAATVGTLDSSDPEFDIGFDTNGDLDTAEIVTRCNNPSGTNYNAYVTKWYDQSGNGNDATQDQYTAMPQIYNGSAVHTVNGKPMLKSAAGVLLTAAGFDVMNSKVFSVASLHRTGVWLQRQVQTGVVTGGWILAAQPSSTSTSLYHTAGFSSLSLAKNGASYTLSGNRDNLYNDFEDQHLLYAAISGVAANSSMQLGYATTPDPYSMWNQQELIIYPSTSSHSQSAIEGNVNAYFQIGNFGTPTSGLLSTYTGAAAAYSVRQLANTAALSMRVRRSNDDAEINIGFNGSGDLDTSAIATHCGSANGYVVTWYDQSGNTNNATQSTGGSQPQIYNGSAVITENGKPTLDFANDQLDTTISLTSNQTIATVVTSHVEGIETLLSSGSTVAMGRTSNNKAFFQSRVQGDTDNLYGTYASNTQQLHFVYRNSVTGSNSFGRINGSEEALNINGTGTVSGTFRIGQLHIAGYFFDGFVQEMILWNDQSSNKAAIETDINDYFSIY